MNNAIMWLIMLLANFILIVLAYKIFGKRGLLVWIPISTIIANIQVIQTVHLFGMIATLGNIVYASSFLVTDILSENYGKRDANQAVWIGFFSLISMVILMNLALLFEPLEGDVLSTKTHESLEMIFNLMPRIAIASLLSYVISQKHDVWAFHFWKRYFPKENQLWIRNNLSTMVSQLIDSGFFTLAAFYGVFSHNDLIQIFVSTYLLKFVVAAADTPFVYLARRIKKKNSFFYDETLR
ncbi:queuosine precursor transporter [Halosquirtibacter laminarini]|uniref:Queuosine transporter n=1 Tax=Halosquirtibacter laminarini TaxID=3374600 RepID=A0AC61NQX3_9BACT|nr:queuosine precursor transporter [Prolixibacteraceae bacterium]